MASNSPRWLVIVRATKIALLIKHVVKIDEVVNFKSFLLIRSLKLWWVRTTRN